MEEHKHSYIGGPKWTTSTKTEHIQTFMCTGSGCGFVIESRIGTEHISRPCACGYDDQCVHVMEIMQISINSEFCHVLNVCKTCRHTQELTKPTKHDWEDGQCRLCKSDRPFPVEKMDNSVSCAVVTPGETCLPCVLKVHKDCGKLVDDPSLHQFDPEGRCSRCHVRCEHNYTRVGRGGFYFFVDPNCADMCGPEESCDLCGNVK